MRAALALSVQLTPNAWKSVTYCNAGVLYSRSVGTLVLAESKEDGSGLASCTLNTITAAQSLGQPITALVAGQSVQPAAAAATKVNGVAQVLVADHVSLKDQLPEPLTALVKALQAKHKYDYIVCPSSSWGKGLLPRVAALLGIQPVSDVTRILDKHTYVRPIYAGNALTTVKYKADGLRMLTVRPSAFPAATQSAPQPAPQQAVSEEDLQAAAAQASTSTSQLISRQLSSSGGRPELGAARVVVCGGRALKSAENFKMLESLADALGGAVGASRAAVDAGMVPNDLQIGQTGKVVAPDLYIGIGISGAIQHVAGIKDAKTIVAINNNPEADLFQIADYGLVGDLFQIVPDLEKEIRQVKKEAKP